MEDTQGDAESLLDFQTFERKLAEALCELSAKRQEVLMCRKELEEMMLKQIQLEQKLDQERTNSETLGRQLEVAVEAVKTCGEQRMSSQAELSRLRVDAELASHTIESLKAKCFASKIENASLHNRVRELENKLQKVEKHNSVETKLTAAFDSLKREVENLEQDKSRLERSVKAAEGLVTELKCSLHLSSVLQSKADQDRVGLRQQVKQLQAELTLLKLNKNADSHLGKKGGKKDEYLESLKDFLAEESDGSKQLRETLQKALENQTTLVKLEKETRDKLQLQAQETLVLKASKEETEKQMLVLRNSNKLAEKDLLATKASIEELEKQLLDLKILKDESDEQLLTLKVSKEDSEKQLLTLKASKENSEKQLLALKASKEESEKQLLALKASKQESEKQIFALRVSKEALENQMVSIRVSKEELEKQILALKASKEEPKT